MKKIVYIFVFVLIYSSGFAQSEIDSAKKSKWSVGISAGPNYSYRKLNFNAPIEENMARYEYMLKLNACEKPDYNFTATLNVERKFGNHFRFRTGINFSRMSYHSIFLDSIYVGTDPLYGYIYLPGKYEFRDNIVSIPLELIYYLPLKFDCLNIYFGSGIFVGLARETFLVNGNIIDTYPYNAYPPTTKSHFEFNALSGFSFSMKNGAMFLEGNYQRALTQKSAPYPISKILYSTGLSIGYKLNL